MEENILQDGPWFWGSTRLFIIPWFPEFDANTMVVSIMLVCVWLHNLPLYFWDDRVLAGIGNIIWKYIKIDTQRLQERIYTYTHMCGSRYKKRLTGPHSTHPQSAKLDNF